MNQRKYYYAYDDRYRQVHSLNLQWFDEAPSKIVSETMQAYDIHTNHKLLEIGCGEGRDAVALLKDGFDLLATDVSPVAVSFCQNKFPDRKECFRVLDCTADSLTETFDFIYAIAVVHMLVQDADRIAFYNFVYEHLKDNAVALVCSMGDGKRQYQSDIDKAFDIQDRIHQPSGMPVQIANTSCRIVDFHTFQSEMQYSHLEIIKLGLTSIEPDFPEMMYAVVKKGSVNQSVAEVEIFEKS